MKTKNLRYKFNSRVKELSISMEIYHPEGYEKSKDPMERYEHCDAHLKFSHYNKMLSLHYKYEELDDIFERVNNSEKGIELLLDVRNEFVQGYSLEHDRLLLRCLLKLEDLVISKLEKNSPPPILDGDTGAS